MDRYLTFLYVRRGNAGVRSIRVHRALAASVVVLVISLIVTSISLIVRYAGQEIDQRRFADLQRENRELKARIDRFQTDVDDLEKRMEANFEMQNRARLLASLEPISKDVWEVGIGGPSPDPIETDFLNPGRYISEFEEDLAKMARQSALEVRSYEEIIAVLQKEQEIRDCTPSIRPLRGGFLSSRFGRRIDPFTGRISPHMGIDFHARTGTPIMATADGIVTMAKKKGSFGLMIEINHGNGFKTKYGHLSKILVRRGQRVKRHEIVGLVGNTGRSTGTHLHYEVVFKGKARNPLQYIIPEDSYFD